MKKRNRVRVRQFARARANFGNALAANQANVRTHRRRHRV